MMKNLKMKYVYDYMLYVLQGYVKLMKLDVTVPENDTEVCSKTMACPITDGGRIRQCMDIRWLCLRASRRLVICHLRSFLRNKKVRERLRSGTMSIGT
ncbi:unnamed protein product [Arabidopsis lyrata]|nr:unnamed protein product [Arabidopsis lyrata]